MTDLTSLGRTQLIELIHELEEERDRHGHWGRAKRAEERAEKAEEKASRLTSIIDGSITTHKLFWAPVIEAAENISTTNRLRIAASEDWYFRIGVEPMDRVRDLLNRVFDIAPVSHE